MAIIKTLLLQAILLLAFLGAIECKDAVTPAVKGKQGADDVPIAANVECIGTKGLKLVCESDSQPSDTDTRAETMMFYKDGDGLGQYKAVTKVTPSADDKDHAEYEIKAAGSELGAADYGVYTCKASTSATFADGLSQASPDYKVVCKACTLNVTCTANTAIGDHSYCKETDGCTCEYGGDLGACNACVDGTNAGCPDVKPYCNADTHTCQVCSDTTHFGCSGNTPRCDSGTSCKKCEPTDNVGCTDPKLPYCPVAGPCKPCDQDNGGKPCDPVTQTCETTGECKAKTTTAASPATGSSGGGTDSKGTTTKASVTSSAGTVTSTACLVIASVVVALMK